MCGIVGYSGEKSACDILINGLSGLEYRGYDSAGVSVLNQGNLQVCKTKGRLSNLTKLMEQVGTPDGSCGIGHTRWATHGEPSDINSHPHGTDRISLVHNGIIENYLSLKAFLTDKGYTFTSQTDTEVAVKLLDYHYNGDPFAALVETLKQLEGAYAFGILFADHPGTIYAVRKDSPLIIGLGEGENFIASDVPAILQYTRQYHLLDELEIACVTQEKVEIRDMDGNLIEKPRLTATWDIAQAQKDGYPHFMLKEIFEQPKALRDTIHPRIRNSLPDFASFDSLPNGYFAKYKRIHMVACGTAMYSGMVGKSLIEQWARIPVEVDMASEFRYRNPIFHDTDLMLVISQSGETADTLAALRLAKASGVDTLAVVNVAGSSIAREADRVIHTFAGPEIAVASTKAFSVQIATLALIAIELGRASGSLTETSAKELTEQLLAAIGQTQQILAYNEELTDMAEHYKDTSSLFYIGRGLDYALSMEGSLKLKEISYIHSEAYAAGELKHGTISLITPGVPVVALVTQSSLLPKIVSNIKEVKSRGAYTLIITKEGLEIDADIADKTIVLPNIPDSMMPVAAVIVLQLFAYHIAVIRGCDVDKPRNLAKSVTVE
ncbi:glutamine--fructose-6-phosphate transaminase (isomerizing) [Oscillospiraceae bacterium MB08-C2-2]|nr:glutamine--fructose-6-phosphate transaminase (isomerizing) [Oscillospiraceae bacterium MB08-C2-2]